MRRAWRILYRVVLLGTLAAGIALSVSPTSLFDSAPPPPPSPGSPAPTPASLRPARTLILHPLSVDLLASGALQRSLPVPLGTVRLEQLASLVGDPRWISEPASGVFSLQAALVQTAGTSLLVGAPGVEVLRLAGPGVFVGGARAQAQFDRVQVESWDPQAGAPVLSARPGRPYIVYRSGSHLQVTASTFSYLGWHYPSEEGVTWRDDPSGGGATESVFERSVSGATVSDRGPVNFVGDTFRYNSLRGLSLTNRVPGSVLQANSAYGNGAEGILITHGATGTQLSGDNVYGNKAAGIAVRQASRTSLANTVATNNRAAGILVQNSSAVTISSTTASHNRVGISIAASSAATVEAAHLVSNLTGAVATASPKANLVNIYVRGSSHAGIVLDAPGASLNGSTVVSSHSGLYVKQGATIQNATISSANRGVVVWAGQTLHAAHLNVSASRVALDLGHSSTAYLSRSSLSAPVPHRGGNVFFNGTSVSRPPFPLLALFGVGLIAVAISLDILRHMRERRYPAAEPPPLVWNTP